MDSDITMELKMGPKSFRGIKDLEEGRGIDEEQILELCKFIDFRLDCSDFRMVTILRVLHSYHHLISEETTLIMKESVLNFKYWMDEPGKDSMCYWSENHQILFFTCAYIAGKLFPTSIFSNSGYTGAEMVSRFEPRIIGWLKHRFNYGFIEWHSNTYYEEDIAPLTLLIDYADKEISKMATIVLDLFAADMAMHNFRGLFSVTSGRCYEEQKRDPLKQDTLEIMEFFFGKRYIEEYDYSRISSNLYLCKNYKLPDIIRDIANDTSIQIVKTSMGHDIRELKGLSNTLGEESIGYIQWAMESFTNPEIIRRTLKMFKRYSMQYNEFLKDFKMLSSPVLYPFLPLISKVLKPYIDGVAIQRVDSYTYRSDGFILSTAQNHYPGNFGDQQHIWQVTIDEQISVFTTHPGASAFDDNARNFSPSYWVGNGIMPHAAQDRNRVLVIYDLSSRKGFMESRRVLFSHAHFPQDRFDDVLIEDYYAFGIKGDVKIALISSSPIRVNPKDASDLIQEGVKTSWVCEVCDGVEDFSDFILRIKASDHSFTGKKLSYNGFQLRYKGDFTKGDHIIPTRYRRLESTYGEWERYDNSLKLHYGDQTLLLNIEKGIREVLDAK